MLRAFVLTFCFALAACGLDRPPEAASVTSPESNSLTPAEVAAPTIMAEEADVLQEFSDLLVAKELGRFRFDRIRKAKAGGQERQIFVEMIGPSDAEAADIAAKALAELGFRLKNRFGDENGVRLIFEPAGDNELRVLVRSREAHSGLESDDATSSVYLTERLAR